MSNAPFIASRAIRSAFVLAFGLMTFASSATAQTAPSFGEQLLGRSAAPTPTAYHLRTQRLLVATRGEVRSVEAPDATRTRDGDLVHASGGETILRIRLDAGRERLWILDTVAVHVVDLVTNQRIRSIALPNWTHATDGTNCLPDLQLDVHGAAFVSDNVQPKLWRIDADDFSVYERTVSLDAYRSIDAGFSALTILPNGAMYAAMAAPGLLWRVDTDLFRAENVPLSAPLYGACAIETTVGSEVHEPALFVLTAGRSSFDVKRVTVATAERSAFVDAVALGSVSGPASLLTWSGALYVATGDAAERARSLALRPIYRPE